MGKDIIFFHNNTCFIIIFFVLPGFFFLFFKNISAIYKYLIESGGTIVFLSLVQDGTIGFLHPA